MKNAGKYATTALGGVALMGALASPAGAQDPDPIDTIDSTDQRVTATTVAPSLQAEGAAAKALQCGSAYDFHKYSTTVAFWTVDVFRHAIRTNGCEDNVNITRIESYQNDCQKYGWGIAYMLRPGFSKGGVGTKSAWGLSTCRVSIGGEIGGVGLQYNKQSNQRHTFNMQSNGNASVAKSHWTTTP